MKSVAKSQYVAQKDAKSEKSQTALNKSQAADGCQQCKKIENEYIECQKKLERSQRQLSKANDYNEDLRKQIDWLSSELHNYRKKAKKKADVGIQTEDAALPMGINSIWKEEWKNYAEINNKDENDDSASEKNLSIVEELKQAAEEAVQGTGYVYDETTGLYYDKNSGYYYDAETALHYDSHTGTYYTFDSYSRTYIFHSQVDPSYLQQSQGETNYPDQSDQNSFKDYRDPAAKATANSSTASSKSSKKRKNKTKKAQMQDMADFNAESRIDTVTEALQNIRMTDPHCLPPCIRIIVMDSDHLDYGSLFIITVDGGTIGREKNQGNLIVIPDINISKVHAQFQYSPDNGQYNLKDFGSQNGTFLNEQRISESKCSSAAVPVKHGDMVQVGCTRLLLHIHPGIETCQDCEPGIVQAAFQAQQIKSIPILSKEEKKKQARQELNQIKKKYGLKNAAYEENSAIKNPNYQDRADERRKTKGSDNPYQVDEAPASVHRPITQGNVGHKMLKKMGWSEGESLGKDNTGIQNPVTVDFRANQKAGLGSVEACSTSLDDIGTAKKNQRWLQAQQRYRKAEVNKQLPTPAWVKEDS